MEDQSTNTYGVLSEPNENGVNWKQMKGVDNYQVKRKKARNHAGGYDAGLLRSKPKRKIDMEMQWTYGPRINIRILY